MKHVSKWKGHTYKDSKLACVIVVHEVEVSLYNRNTEQTKGEFSILNIPPTPHANKTYTVATTKAEK